MKKFTIAAVTMFVLALVLSLTQLATAEEEQTSDCSKLYGRQKEACQAKASATQPQAQPQAQTCENLFGRQKEVCKAKVSPEPSREATACSSLYGRQKETCEAKKK